MPAADTAATPIVDVALQINGARRIVGLKLEGFNSGGSIKARTAASLVANLESERLLRPGDTVVESTSGNLGVALALICAQRGYSFVAIVDPKIDPSVLDRMRAAKAEIVMVDQPDAGGGYLLTRLAEVRRLMAQRRMVWPNQYENAANPAAHFNGTGPELIAQRPDLDAVFIATSTGGTLAGVSRYLRTRSQATVIAVDVYGSQTFASKPAPRLLNGIGSSRRSSFLTPADYDRVVFVSDREAIAACHALEARSQISVGGSSGAALAACARLLAEAPELRRPVCICPDDGANYRHTIFCPRWLAAHDVDPIDDASMLAFTDACVV